MYVERTTEVGVDIVAWGTIFHIAGVKVDNPTGSWVHIPNVGDVPPYVIGWTRGIDPAAISIDVRFTPSPSGATSDPTLGGLVVVTIYDYQLPDHPGYASGVEAQTAGAAQRYQLALTGAVTAHDLAGGGPDDFIVIAGPTTNIIIPLRITLNGLVSGTGRDIRGLLQASLSYTPPGGFPTTHAVLTITRYHPSDRYDFLPGELVIPAESTNIKFGTSVENGVGDQRIWCVLGYYEIEVVT